MPLVPAFLVPLATPPVSRGAIMIALAGLLAVALFVYLFYALIRPERF